MTGKRRQRGSVERRGRSTRVIVGYTDPITGTYESLREKVPKGVRPSDAKKELVERVDALVKEREEEAARQKEGREEALSGEMALGAFMTDIWIPHLWSRVEKRNRARANMKDGAVLRGGLEESTAKRNERIARTHIILAAGETPLKDLDDVAIDAFMTEKQLTGRLDGTGGLGLLATKDIFTILSAALDYAVFKGLIPTNPARLVELVAEVDPSRPKVPLEVAVAFLKAAWGSLADAPVALALGLGLREGEMLPLQWTDEDREGHVMDVVRASKVGLEGRYIAQPKSEASRRRIAMPVFVEEALRRQEIRQAERRLAAPPGVWHDEGLILDRGDGAPWHHTGLWTAFDKVREQAGYPEVQFRDLRAAHGTLLLSQGVSMEVIRDRLGHSSSKTTEKHYAKVVDDRDREAADKTDTALGGVNLSVVQRNERKRRTGR